MNHSLISKYNNKPLVIYLIVCPFSGIIIEYSPLGLWAVWPYILSTVIGPVICLSYEVGLK